MVILNSYGMRYMLFKLISNCNANANTGNIQLKQQFVICKYIVDLLNRS